MSGNCSDFSLPFLDHSRACPDGPHTSSTIARIPSYFGS